MAKDKSKKDKGAKAEKATKGGADLGFAKPSEAPSGGDDWKLASDEHLGELFLFEPLRKETVKTESYGEKEVIVANVVHLNRKKPEKSEAHDEVFVFGAWLQGSLRAFIGERLVLGTLAKGEAKKGQSAPWILEDATEAEVEAAKAYLASVDPFAKSK